MRDFKYQGFSRLLCEGDSSGCMKWINTSNKNYLKQRNLWNEEINFTLCPKMLYTTINFIIVLNYSATLSELVWWLIVIQNLTIPRENILACKRRNQLVNFECYERDHPINSPNQTCFARCDTILKGRLRFGNQNIPDAWLLVIQGPN